MSYSVYSQRGPKVHDENGYSCWCNPRLMRLCSECEGIKCETCGFSGLTEVTPEAAALEEVDLVVIHHSDPEDELSSAFIAACECALEKLMEDA